MPLDARSRWRRWMGALTRPRAPEAFPVEFDRRRIYVLPTRFGLFFSVLMLVMLGGALNYNNNPALLLGLLLVGAGLASLVAAQLQLGGLRIVAVDAAPVPAGSTLRVRMYAQAAGKRIRRGLQVDDEGRTDARGRLDLADGAGQVELSFPTETRGWFEVPRLRISTTRPLGLARAWSHAWPNVPLLVYPNPEPTAPPLPEALGELAKSRIHPGGEDVHHLRAYRTGDSKRAIAWKHSARRDTLLVREYEQPIGAEIVLDWRELHGLAHEARISRLARWIDDAEREGRRYRLVLPGPMEFGPDHGDAHRHACLRALALMPHG